MKVSPVVGTPTIAQPSQTSITPDKRARAISVATGQPAPENTEEKKEELAAALQNKITMSVNKTPQPVVPEAEGTEIKDPGEGSKTPEITKSDTDVQADASATELTEASEATQPLSPQLAALARQRRALQTKEKELAEREKAITGPSRADLEAKIKASPLSVLQELGVTYDQLTQEILNGKSDPKIQALETEIATLRKELGDYKTENENTYEERAVNYVADKLDGILASEDFEFLRSAEGEEEVVRRVYSHWKRTGQELDVRKAAEEYQNELIEEAARFAQMKQVQKKLTPAEPVQSHAPQQPGMKTLTNKDSARPSMDRRTRAILAMQGQLPKR